MNQASVSAIVGVKNLAAYSAARGAVVALTRSMAMDLAPFIRVNVLCPGTVHTPLMEPPDRTRRGGPGGRREDDRPEVPDGTLGTPEDITRAALFLASESAFFTGAVLVPDGGMSAQ